jgi:hypothetical protein
MGTNLNFTFINDLTSQALAWIYLGKNLDILRPMGLRSAYEIHSFVSQYNSDDSGEKKRAIDLLSQLAKSVNLTKEELWNAFVQVAEDPNTTFLVEVFDLSSV